KYAKPSGEVNSAVSVGQNINEVRHHLQEQGLLPINIRQRGWSLSFRSQHRRQVIKADDYILSNEHFVAVIRAGLPILESLDRRQGQIRIPLYLEPNQKRRDRVR